MTPGQIVRLFRSIGIAGIEQVAEAEIEQAVKEAAGGPN
jgi:hypothetical protein